MKKNKLYTVNRWNRPAFMPEGNLFAIGGVQTTGLGGAGGYNFSGYTNSFNVGNGLGFDAGKAVSAAGGTSGSGNGGFGGGKAAALQTAAGVGLNLMDSISTGDKRGMWDTLDPVYHLADGRETGAGNAMSDAGVALTKSGLQSGQPYMALAGAALKVVGGLTNAAFGIKENKERKKAADASINTNRNFVSNATSFDDIKGPAAKVGTNIYEGGWFSGGKARDKNEQYALDMANAFNWADASVTNNAYNIFSDKIGNTLREYHAYGGPLNSFGSGALGIMQNDKFLASIDKRTDALANKNSNQSISAFTGGARTFADGGLKAAFMDEFGTDPIGAAVRYNQGLERMAAQKEAAEAEAAKEADYLATQKRLADLETQNQGLQAMMAAQSMPTVMPDAEPTLSSVTSTAARKPSGNNTWDYIEGQLRKSRKFNDIQIEGIKYNLQRESSIDPNAVGDDGQAFGLGQWHGARKPKDMSLEGQTQHLIDTLSNYDGKEHWIGRGNYEGFLNARTPEEAHYWITKGYERPRKDIIEKVKRDSDMSLRRLNAFGGELGTNGTDFTNGLLYIDEGGTHEENPMEGVPMGVDAEGIPNLVEEGETVYNNYVFSDRMNVPTFMYKELGLGGVMKKKGKGMSFADASKKLAKESEQRPNDPISQDGLEASLSRLAEVQEAERMKQQAEEYMGLEGYACGGKMGKKYAKGGNRDSDRNYDGVHANDIKPFDSEKAALEVEKTRKPANAPVIDEATRQRIAMDGFTPEILSTDAGNIDVLTNGVNRGTDYNPYPTWMRYAPVIGSGAMALTDMLGLTNKPDYTYADKLEAAANRAGYAPDIQYKPIGDYMRYTPLDRMFQQNQLNAIARAADRTIMNSSLPTASKYAALLAANYNNQISAGNLFRQAEESNRAQYERTKDFNRKTNMFNSQLDLEAAMANARYRQAAQQMGLSGLAQAAALRDSIDARTGAAKAANLSNFFTSLGNIGRENFALNQINSDRSRQYGVYSNGVSEYKRSSKGKKGSRWYNG